MAEAEIAFHGAEQEVSQLLKPCSQKTPEKLSPVKKIKFSPNSVNLTWIFYNDFTT